MLKKKEPETKGNWVRFTWDEGEKWGFETEGKWNPKEQFIWGPSKGNDPLEEDLKKPFFVWANYKDHQNDWNYNRYPKWNHPDATGGPPDPNHPGVKMMLLKANWPKKALASFETLEEAKRFAELPNEDRIY